MKEYIVLESHQNHETLANCFMTKKTRSKRSVGALFQNTPTCCWAQTPRSQRAGVLDFCWQKKCRTSEAGTFFVWLVTPLGFVHLLWKHTDLPVQRLFGRPVSTAFPGRNSRPTVTQPFNMLGEPKIHQIQNAQFQITVSQLQWQPRNCRGHHRLELMSHDA